ncbi:hypothetical protein [Shewanella mangrovi]|uniref:hypothetical protein n=1 Tax=Shewanella mangrovi TaxID=1515746 RepID=UPI000B01D87B|nr:hypothetical protein [Shewanella mangrovi]
MWNWIEKLMGKPAQPIRKRVPMEIPFEQIDSRSGRVDDSPTDEFTERELKDS